MNREFDQGDFDKINIPENKIIAKHIMKEAIALSFIDGDYSKDEQDIIRKWALKNGFEESFVEALEIYVMVSAGLDKMGEDLLNTHPSSVEAHNYFKKLQSMHDDL